jgi:predicted transcriptional regulator
MPMPRVPNSTNVTTVVPVEMHRDLQEIAKREDRTVSNLMRGIIGSYLARRRRAAAKAGESKQEPAAA